MLNKNGSLVRFALSTFIVLGSQLAAPTVRAAEFFQWIDGGSGGQVFVTPVLTREFANHAGGSGGQVGSTSGRFGPAGEFSFFVGFQIPSHLQYSLSAVGVSGSYGGIFDSFASGSIHLMPDSTVVPAIGETWNGIQQNLQISQLAAGIAGETVAGFSTASGHGGSFGSINGGDLVTAVLAKQGDILYLGGTGFAGGTEPLLTISGLSLQLFTNESNVSVVPVPAAGWLFGSALAGFIGWRGRRKVIRTPQRV
jgi:hypothetical protein